MKVSFDEFLEIKEKEYSFLKEKKELLKSVKKIRKACGTSHDLEKLEMNLEIEIENNEEKMKLEFINYMFLSISLMVCEDSKSRAYRAITEAENVLEKIYE